MRKSTNPRIITFPLARADETAKRESVSGACAHRGMLSTVVILVAMLGDQAPTPRQGVTTSLGIVYLTDISVPRSETA